MQIRCTPLTVFLIAEWPLLAIACGLHIWAVYSLGDAYHFHTLSGTQAGADSGAYGFNYGTQLVPAVFTNRVRTTDAAGVPSTTTIISSYSRTIYPYIFGTSYYGSEYSSLGYIPEPITALPSSSTPTPAPTSSLQTTTTTSPAAARTATAVARQLDRRDWINPRSSNGGLFNTGSDTQSFVGAMLIPFGLLVFALAWRLLLTPLHVLLGGASGLLHKRRAWAITNVCVTTIALTILLGAGMAGYILLGSYFDYAFRSSPGLIVTIVFYALACVSTIVAMSLAAKELSRIKRHGAAYIDGHMYAAHEKDGSVVVDDEAAVPSTVARARR